MILTKTLLLPAACLSVLLSVYPVLVLLKNMVTNNLQVKFYYVRLSFYESLDVMCATATNEIQN